MTYEERVQKVKKSLYASATCFAPFQEVTGNAHWKPAAKGAISMQAKAIRQYVLSMFPNNEAYAIELADKYLKQNGYIPEKEGQ
jgi:hypothetical protein